MRPWPSTPCSRRRRASGASRSPCRASVCGGWCGWPCPDMRRGVSALLIGAALLVPSAAVAQEAVEVDQDAILAPVAEDTPTATPTPSPVATMEGSDGPVVVTQPRGDNAAMRPAQAKEREATSHCVANPSLLLAAGGSERVDEGRSWAWLPWLIAA